MLIRVLSGLYVYDFFEIVKPICSFSLLTSLGRQKYTALHTSNVYEEIRITYLHTQEHFIQKKF